MAFQLTAGKFTASTDTGAPASGYLLYTYVSGTTTPQATYTDAGLTSPNTNPVVLNARGEADVWLGSATYTFLLKTPAGVTVWSVDGVIAPDSNVLNNLASTSLGKGASLVGINDAGGYILSTTVEGALQEIGQVFSTAVGKGASLVGINDAGNLITATNVEGALQELAAYKALLSGATLAGMRNILTNGDFRFDQRWSGGSYLVFNSSIFYTVDRWYATCAGANVTGQRVAGTSPEIYAYRLTGNAGVTSVQFGQRIEAADSAHLAGSNTTLTVSMANTLLTSVTWTAYYANTTDSFGTFGVPTRTQFATGTFTVSSTMTKFTAQIAVPAAATTGLEIVFTVGAQTSGTWTFNGGIQWELGTNSTTFERRPFAQELARCQRYYEVAIMRILGNAPGAVATPATSIPFQATKRKVPTTAIIVGSTTGFNNASAVNLNAAGTTSVAMDIVASAAGNCFVTAAVSADAEL